MYQSLKSGILAIGMGLAALPARATPPVDFHSSEVKGACPNLGLNYSQTEIAQLLAENAALRAQHAVDVVTIERLNKQNEIDVLTVAKNKAFLDGTLIKTLNRLPPKSLAVLMLDLDMLKKLNSTYGHQETDRALQAFAQAASASIREGQDFLVRVGGDEFVIVLQNVTKDGAENIANKVREQLRKFSLKQNLTPQPVAGFDPLTDLYPKDYMTTSIGLVHIDDVAAKLTSREGASILLKSAIQLADIGAYESKLNGRDQVTPKDYLNQSR